MGLNSVSCRAKETVSECLLLFIRVYYAYYMITFNKKNR
jgi:hypothetical protein